MLTSLKKLFFEEKSELGLVNNQLDNHKIEIATCALFIELAKADGNFSDDEKLFIISLMKDTFNLNEQELNIIFEVAEQKADQSVSIYEFTSKLNDHFNQSQKEAMVKNLWRLIYKDQKLNAYEDSLIKKIGLTLNLEHKRIIELKMAVKQELNID
jgi:uncharacterized tellurite resistance protein B-like protein